MKSESFCCSEGSLVMNLDEFISFKEIFSFSEGNLTDASIVPLDFRNLCEDLLGFFSFSSTTPVFALFIKVGLFAFRPISSTNFELDLNSNCQNNF